MKLSIIIPAYNPGEYLDKLIECLKPQITSDVEVIVIDDGSAVPVKVPRFVNLIRQTNGGASAARNTGLDMATGDYIALIDMNMLVDDVPEQLKETEEMIEALKDLKKALLNDKFISKLYGVCEKIVEILANIIKKR